MRKLLFRGKRKKDGRCVSGQNIIRYSNGAVTIIPSGTTTFIGQTEKGEMVVAIAFDDIEKEAIAIGDETDTVETDIDPDTVGQFTGLVTEAGIEVFEGDIIKDPMGDPAVVEYIEKSCGFWANSTEGREWSIDFCLSDCHCEVIGNIYDNPDLMGRDLPNPMV